MIKVKNLDKPIEKQREDKTHYFRKKNWKKSKKVSRWKNMKNIAIGFVIGVFFIFVVCLAGNSSDVKANKNFSVKIQYEDFNKVLYIVTDNETRREYIVFKAGDGTAITPRLK